MFKQIGNRIDLSADEAPLEVGVDHPCTLGSQPPVVIGPGANLFRPRSEIGLESQQFVCGASQAVQARLCQTKISEELLLILGIVICISFISFFS